MYVHKKQFHGFPYITRLAVGGHLETACCVASFNAALRLPERGNENKVN